MKEEGLPFERVSLKYLEDKIVKNGNLMSYIDTCGFFLCQKGEVQVNADGKTWTIKEGDVYLYLPATFVYVLSSSDDLQGIMYKSRIDFILPLLERTNYTHFLISIREKPIFRLSAKQANLIENSFAAIEERIELLEDTTSPTNILKEALYKMGEGLIHEIFYYYFSNETVNTTDSNKRDQVFQSFLVMLMKNYKKEREVKYYADMQCLTPRYFSSIIKEKSGKTVQQWISQMVINSTKQSLIYTSKSIKEIAIEYNFPTQSFFGKYFKQYVGISPKEFRSQSK